MTTATVNPAVVASYSADDIKRQLVAGRSVQQVADRTGWPRQRVTAIINGVRGWMLDPNSDKVYELSERNKQIQPRLPTSVVPEGDDPEPDRRPQVTVATEPIREQAAPSAPPTFDLAELRQTELLAAIGRILGMLAKVDDPAAAKDVVRSREALTRLEATLTIGERRRQAEADLAAAEQVVAEAKARLKELKSGRIPAAPAATRTANADEPTPKEIRAWAAANGVECAPNGKIPGPVRQQYDASRSKKDGTAD